MLAYQIYCSNSTERTKPTIEKFMPLSSDKKRIVAAPEIDKNEIQRISNEAMERLNLMRPQS